MQWWAFSRVVLSTLATQRDWIGFQRSMSMLHCSSICLFWPWLQSLIALVAQLYECKCPRLNLTPTDNPLDSLQQEYGSVWPWCALIVHEWFHSLVLSFKLKLALRRTDCECNDRIILITMSSIDYNRPCLRLYSSVRVLQPFRYRPTHMNITAWKLSH